MNEACDRCGPAVRAAYRADRDGQLYLCGHCASRLRRAMSARGWTIRPVSKYTLAPHATSPSGGPITDPDRRLRSRLAEDPP
jgi:hypothetical protein